MTAPDGSMNGHEPGGVPPGLQPRPVPTGWRAEAVVFRRPGESLHMAEMTFFHPTGQFVLFLAPSDLGRLIKNLQDCKQEVERRETRDKGPAGLTLPQQPKLVLPGDPTTGG